MLKLAREVLGRQSEADFCKSLIINDLGGGPLKWLSINHLGFFAGLLSLASRVPSFSKIHSWLYFEPASHRVETSLAKSF